MVAKFCTRYSIVSGFINFCYRGGYIELYGQTGHWLMVGALAVHGGGIGCMVGALAVWWGHWLYGGSIGCMVGALAVVMVGALAVPVGCLCPIRH